jgi:hypothetical protein
MRTLLLLVALAGCRTRPLPEPDAGSVDAAPVADLSAFDATLDAACTLAPVPMTMLHVDDLNQCPLDFLRMTFQISLDACRPIGPTLIVYDPATNGYTLTAQACTMPLCQPPPKTVELTVFLSEVARPKPGTVMVRDGAPGGMLSTAVPIQSPLANGLCGTVSQTGCRSDAECEMSDPSQRCWYDGGRCVRPCGSDADCAGVSAHCQLGLCL